MLGRVVMMLAGTLGILSATQEFSIDVMKQYLNEKNPYISSELIKKRVSQEQLNYVKGSFDTALVAKYEEKDYPLSDGTYYGASLIKPTESGIDLSAGYRYAKGTQEYNNIKTGKNGEFLIGATIPLVSVLNKIDQRRLRLALAQTDLKNTDFAYKERMRQFYFTLMSQYYSLLHNKERLAISEDLLEKARLRERLIEQSVTSGNLPQATLIEAKQQKISREQALLSAQNTYENTLINFLKYLNLTPEAFHAQYHLGHLSTPEQTAFNFDVALEKALQNRPDLQILALEIEKLLIENRANERLQYPEFDVGLYGVYDVDDESGFKVALNMRFPLAQTQYLSKNAQIKESMQRVRAEQEVQLLELKADLQSLITSLDTVIQNLNAAQEEQELLLKLEAFEQRKYTLGSSSLFLLNQREMQTMEAQMKVLAYKLEYQLLYHAYYRSVNEPLF
jgi:outer membrane protein TolC